MVQRTDPDDAVYLGVVPVAISGTVVRCHVWDDGTELPVLVGFDGDDDSGDDDGDEGDDEGDEDENDEDDDDDEDDPDKIKDPKRRRAAKQAASYRIQRNKARQERDELKTKLTEASDKIKQLEKDGAGDDALKTKISDLEKERDELKAEVDRLSKANRAVSIERQVRDTVKDEKLNLKEDTDYVLWLLDKQGMLDVDEDGEVEDLAKNLKKLVKSGKLHVVDDDDEDDDEADEEGDGKDKAGTSGTAKKSGRRDAGRRRTSKEDHSRAALEKKYPALRR